MKSAPPHGPATASPSEPRECDFWTNSFDKRNAGRLRPQTQRLTPRRLTTPIHQRVPYLCSKHSNPRYPGCVWTRSPYHPLRRCVHSTFPWLESGAEREHGTSVTNLPRSCLSRLERQLGRVRFGLCSLGYSVVLSTSAVIGQTINKKIGVRTPYKSAHGNNHSNLRLERGSYARFTVGPYSWLVLVNV